MGVVVMKDDGNIHYYSNTTQFWCTEHSGNFLRCKNVVIQVSRKYK